MRVTATDRVAAVIDRVRETRHGALTITIGTGCCESTAPFLYEDFWPGPDQEQIGVVAGVPVFAPGYLRGNYPGDDGVMIDVLEDQQAESMSIETELDCRLILRSIEALTVPIDPAFGVDLGSSEERDDACRVASTIPAGEENVASVATGGPSQVVGELPANLRQLRLR